MTNRTGSYVKLIDITGYFDVLFDAMFLCVDISSPLVGSITLDYTPKERIDKKNQDDYKYPLPIPPWVIPEGTTGKVYAPRISVHAGRIDYQYSNPLDSGMATVVFAN